MLGRSWAVLREDAPELPCLVCFHFAGGSAQTFLPWRKHVEGRYSLLAAELPGRGRRYGETFASSVYEAAAQFAEEAVHLPQKPLIFVGHSLGALLAYETAYAMRERGSRQAIGLVAAARQSPDVDQHGRDLPDSSMSAMRKYLQDLSGTPESILRDDAYMTMMRPILQSDFDLLRSYWFRPRAPLQIPLHVVGAIHDHAVKFESLLGWSRLSAGELSLSLIDGGHFAPLEQPASILDKADRIAGRVASASIEEQLAAACD
ncbi:thioesterase II family protein [Methylobacterium sp. R2-1]|uniref:thioesterase II family protein n=1 Tax=Methylobacterium sp. R2-1 TaxID=2587064 RepID=UPI001AEDD951|nr:alpha/beta fold hydrolase [Methylobacterium sp. R2-1]